MSNIEKRSYRADGGDISVGRLKVIAENPYDDKEKCWLAKYVVWLQREMEAAKRVTELERAVAKLIEYGDNAEQALADMFSAIRDECIMEHMTMKGGERWVRFDWESWSRNVR